MLCPACERGEASPCAYADTFKLQDAPAVVVDGLEGWRCPNCDETFITADQARRNESRINEARANG